MNALAIAELLNEGSDARWGNLGDWAAGDRYGDAARRLARALGRMAGLGPGQRVLDVGCGCGDQLAVWVEEFGVDEVLALEPDPGLLAVASRAVEERGFGDRITFRRAHASALASLAPASFDRVLAVDCAYLFGSRRRTAEDAFRLLGPGGRFALTDLLLGRTEHAPLLDRLAPAFGIERGYLVSPERYRRELLEVGFAATELELAGDRVLAGFARHVRDRLPALLRAGRASVPVLVTAAACAAAARSERLAYTYLCATRSR